MNPFFFPRLGGIERRIYHLGRELAGRGHKVTVLTGGADPKGAPVRERMAGFDVVRLPTRRLPVKWDPPVERASGVAEALAELDPDLVDFHYRWAPEWTRAVERQEAPWVFTWHNQFGEGSGLLRPLSLLNDAGYRRRVQREAGGARAIVCVSQHIRRELEGRRFDPRHLQVVANGSQRPEPDGPEWQPDDGRALPESPYFVAVGRLTVEKGNDLVLRAFAHAVHGGTEARLVLCGRGPQAGRLQRLASTLGVQDRVTFGGWVPEATKWRLMEGATAMVHMARFESYGIAVAEGIVAGLPVVAADVGGVSEVVGPAGHMVPAGDVRAAGEALARMARDPAWRDGLAGEAQRRGPTMAWGAVARQMETLYAEALAS
ncbi:MAG TPA: glycosyltransferase family 4 protein [Candidatus Thermoplasmatota archaeon]|nr:glycosyltransferase family 4 protein [Candidatus Thermoplasmatota archaeon]